LAARLAARAPCLPGFSVLHWGKRIKEEMWMAERFLASRARFCRVHNVEPFGPIVEAAPPTPS
jgi:hypothetical protein